MSAMIRAHVILENAGGELAREAISVDPAKTDDVDAAIDEAITHVVEGFVLSIGDTIRIVEAS